MQSRNLQVETKCEELTFYALSVSVYVSSVFHFPLVIPLVASKTIIRDGYDARTVAFWIFLASFAIGLTVMDCSNLLTL